MQEGGEARAFLRLLPWAPAAIFLLPPRLRGKVGVWGPRNEVPRVHPPPYTRGEAINSKPVRASRVPPPRSPPRAPQPRLKQKSTATSTRPSAASISSTPGSRG